MTASLEPKEKSVAMQIKSSRTLAAAAALTVSVFTGGARAQLPAQNEGGIGTGHVHLRVPDVDKHAEIWKTLGGVEKTSGRLRAFSFPGIYVMLAEGEPTAPSSATVVNHVGFAIQDYAAYKAKLEEVGATIVFDNADPGQVIADLPDGVRIELAVEPGLPAPIAFHHFHLSAVDGGALQQWYVDTFAAEKGERRGLPSAVVPGGRVDFLPVRGDAPLPSKGAAIDHIGFEAADMATFAARMGELGVTFDREPTRVDAINLTIAFITDPSGAYIEITEGLDDIE